MSKWVKTTLAEIADIKVSNVDKKSYQGEKAVMLCNYMDVYSNNYISRDITFMEATANVMEISKFTVSKGDVLITKDSETPFDIGIPAVVVDEIDNLICGYHLAQLKPNEKKVDSIFLAKQLSVPEISSYFSRVAAGSTRYGLSNNSIAKTILSLPSLETQKNISRVLVSIDNAIMKTELLIDKYQLVKKGMSHDLFSRGLDSNGGLRPIYNEKPELYKETEIGWIPKEWVYMPLSWGLSSPPKNGYSPKEVNEWQGIHVLGLGCLTKNGFKPIHLKNAPSSCLMNASKLNDGDFLISRANTPELVGLCGIYKDVGNIAIYPDLMMRLSLNHKIDADFLERYLLSPLSRQRLSAIAVGTSNSMVKLNSTSLRTFKIAYPCIDEQRLIIEKLKPLEIQITLLESELEKLKGLKFGLTYDLLTRKVLV